MAAIALNARFYSHVPTGMQRYGIEMANRLGGILDVVKPSRALKGTEGHMWEQLYLPSRSRGRLLWSPNNTGPLMVRRQVCTIHDIIPIDRPEWFNSRFSGWYNWLLPKLVHRVSHLIAVSEFTRQRVIERFGVPSGKISVVWNGVDRKFRPATEAEIAAMRIELGIRSPRYLVYVGSVEPRKNLGGLLDAWRLVAKHIPEDIQLVVAGGKGASLVFADPKLGKTPERVQFTGYVKQDQLPALYSGAMALVYPSLYEGFGLPAVEAMACGTPAVVSNTTSLPEVVGPNAVLVDPGDSESIAEGIRTIVVDNALRARLREAGLKWASAMSWDQAAAQTQSILAAFV
jgi:glycosyltransferase involved in cell wall biosynthesis